MAKPPFPKFTADQRESMKVLDAHMLRVARPFFWHIGARNDGVPKGASAFILRFERGYVAVTCNHVLEQYEDALKADARMICQLGTCQVWPEKSLIDRNKKLDIATFEVSEESIEIHWWRHHRSSQPTASRYQRRRCHQVDGLSR